MLEDRILNIYLKHIVDEHIKNNDEINSEDITILDFRKWYNIFYTVYPKSTMLKIPKNLNELFAKVDNINIKSKM